MIAAVAERTEPYSTGEAYPGFTRESDLAAAWASGAFPRKGLADGTGKPVRVIYRGRKGAGPGPDFRDAILAWKTDRPSGR
jgi:hypothetical protein